MARSCKIGSWAMAQSTAALASRRSLRMSPKPLATDAVSDLLVFLTVAENRPDAAFALSECLVLGLSVVVCHPDRDATVIAGKPRFRFELNERLARYLPAF